MKHGLKARGTQVLNSHEKTVWHDLQVVLVRSCYKVR